MKFAIRRHSLRLRYPDDRNAGWNEMTDATFKADPNAILSGKTNQAIDIDKSDVPRLSAEHHRPLFV